MPETNPLLDIDAVIPFDRIKPEHIEPAVALRLSQATAALEAIAAAPPSVEGTLLAFDRATTPLDILMTVVGHLESVVTSEALREVYNRVRPEVSAFYGRIMRDGRLYKALLALEGSEAGRALTGPKARYLKDLLAAFRREGAALDAAKQARLEAISRELAELTGRFSQNLVDETAAYELYVTEEARLEGLPETAKAAARAEAEAKGQPGWRFSLQAPSLIPALTYLKDAALRETLHRAYNTRASTGERDNLPLIAAILKLRQERAALLGFEDFSDLVLEDRMAKSGAAAADFVAGLKAKTVAAFAAENEALAAFRREQEGDQAPPLAPWDVGYYAERQRQARYDFDEEALRPYFPLPSVLRGVFQTAERLYGVQVTPVDDLPTWHPEVQTYALREGDQELGRFYVDLFPREEKRGGAWMDAFITSLKGAPGGQLGLICANFTRPVGEGPALLSHREVETLFHEFGHLLHHLLTEAELYSQAGTSVAWDFVELPSQIMENWCWQREALDMFARHVDTGEPIPAALFDKMLAARSYRAANAMMRQLGFANVDLQLHRGGWGGPAEELGDYCRAQMQVFSPAPLYEGYAFIAGFGHLFSSSVGYAAGYYSYKWAEVLDADAFTRFEKEGVFNPALGDEFRRKLLARGDAEDPAKLYRDFMGRDPDPAALFRRAGLA